MTNVSYIEDYRKEPHVVQEVICVKCCTRWIAVAPKTLLLKNYECNNCGKGYVIKTGQEINNNESS